MIIMNLIKNARITMNNIILAEKAFGPDVGEMLRHRNKIYLGRSEQLVRPKQLIQTAAMKNLI